ncbi:hypothetical protein ABT124_03235 [Streptomyces sp. NPDC001982]|uniref:hypothetical protein n=1 Tax=Streptomyces sp. NPDC001982 TaxID=3154405 RepID=UPI00332BF6A8
MSALTIDYRGEVAPAPREGEPDGWEETRAHLAQLAEQFPVGARITHSCGRPGTVVVDQPDHVPGRFDGQPSAVCLAGPWHDTEMVFAHWDNDLELTWGVWVPVDTVRRSATLAANRPGNRSRRALVGGRR